MSINLNSHAFAGNPIRSKTHDSLSPSSAFQSLKTHLLQNNSPPKSPLFKVLPFRKGRPLASSSITGGDDDDVPDWHLGWISLPDCRGFLGKCGVELNEDSLVYLGSKAEDDVVYWAVDVSEESGLVPELGSEKFCFVELRTLMVGTDWDNSIAMGELAIAGHARALLEWHNLSRFCGSCGEKTVPKEAGRRKQCSNELCKKRIYPRLDPVVIMLVIDKENDRALLSRQSRFVPRMWSCLAGFIEPGESLEEAVRRETYEETGIEVGEVVYHSSQPWPVGPSSMPCQLMVGFFAYAKSLEINVDKEELEANDPVLCKACLTYMYAAGDVPLHHSIKRPYREKRFSRGKSVSFEASRNPIPSERRSKDTSIAFTGPKTLAQIREEKRKTEENGRKTRRAVGIASSDFQGPKPLSEILKDKQRPTRTEQNFSS